MWQIIVVALGLLGTGFGATPLEKNSWAFLVAGSNTWWNYRHQADVCHAYHVMIAEGIPPERIIVMMYDDIAYNKRNPDQGVIINKPGGLNVYAGVTIDYRGDDVNPENFLNILRGNKAALKGIGSGRVIESDENDNIFVNFAGHGSTALLAFPSDVLMADELLNTLKFMHQNKLYKKLILYIEACFSGSLFDGLLEENTHVYALTAAARDEPSHCCYSDKRIGVPLGDRFSVTWMENMDNQRNGSLETFFHQFQYVRSRVQSHVNIYGDFSFGFDNLTPNKESSSFDETRAYHQVVRSDDATFYWFKVKANRTKDPEDLEYVEDLIHGRQIVDQLFADLAGAATLGNPELKSTILDVHLPLSMDIFPCYKSLLDQFRSDCLGLEHEYAFRYFHVLANMCIKQLNTADLQQKMPSVCSPHVASIKTPVL